VVVVHQPVAVTQGRDRSNLLRGHDVATRVWSAAGADVVMGGHIHLPYTLALQSLGRRLWVVQAGTAVSSRTRAGVPNSVNILRWGEAKRTPSDTAACCFIERWDFAGRERGFVRTAVSPVQPDRA
jgi:hypothetical protein